MIDYSEKRDFRRMTLECPVYYRLRGAKQPASGTAKNLSGGGVLLLTQEPLEARSELALAILPGKTVTPPLSAYAKVLRCDPVAEGRYEVACRITRVLDEDEVGQDFP
jgi:hypothetical protein